MLLKPFEESTMEERIVFLSEFDKLPERVRQYIWEDMKDLYVPLQYGLLRFVWNIAAAFEFIRKCESPIEQLLCYAMEAKLPHFTKTKMTTICLHPQEKIKTDSGNYRVDFLVQFCIFKRGFPDEWKYLVVECDGHNFHEKTKTQVARDKKRDRSIQSLGYPILRFTGSEIYRDPDACVNEIASFIDNALTR